MKLTRQDKQKLKLAIKLDSMDKEGHSTYEILYKSLSIEHLKYLIGQQEEMNYYNNTINEVV